MISDVDITLSRNRIIWSRGGKTFEKERFSDIAVYINSREKITLLILAIGAHLDLKTEEIEALEGEMKSWGLWGAIFRVDV